MKLIMKKMKKINKKKVNPTQNLKFFASSLMEFKT